jgi:hypothetical protein
VPPFVTIPEYCILIPGKDLFKALRRWKSVRVCKYAPEPAIKQQFVHEFGNHLILFDFQVKHAYQETENDREDRCNDTTDEGVSPFIRMAGLMAPRAIGVFLPNMDQKQREAFDKVMPAGGKKKIYFQLVGTPTPPIVIGMAQPFTMDVLSESEIKKQGIKGIKLPIEKALQPLTEKKIGKVIWLLKGQLGTLLGLSSLAMPLLLLGPAELKDLKNKAMTHFKPMLDMLPH